MQVPRKIFILFSSVNIDRVLFNTPMGKEMFNVYNYACIVFQNFLNRFKVKLQLHETGVHQDCRFHTLSNFSSEMSQNSPKFAPFLELFVLSIRHQ